MYVLRHERLGLEILRWLALLTLAAAAAAAMTSTVDGQIRATVEAPRPSLGEVATQLWQVCDMHRHAGPARAREMWLAMGIPCETEVWRQVAVGVTHLRGNELEEAAAALDEAEFFEADNPVVHYFMGILRLEQARLADEWYEPAGEGAFRYVSFGVRPIVPNTRSMFELVAIMELKAAVALAATIDLEMPLLPSEMSFMEVGDLTMPVEPPTVGYLLDALGADNFAGRAHNILAYLYLDRNALGQAERHLDAARASGLHTVYGYRDLAERYEAEDLHVDALRAHIKSLTEGGSLVTPMRRAWGNLREALHDLF